MADDVDEMLGAELLPAPNGESRGRAPRGPRRRHVTERGEVPFRARELGSPLGRRVVLVLTHTIGLPERIATALRKLAGVRSAFIYGSWAARRSGEIGPLPADIDLLVVGTTKREEIRNALRPLERELNVEINPVVVSVRDWSSADSDLLNELRACPIFELDLGRSSAA